MVMSWTKTTTGRGIVISITCAVCVLLGMAIADAIHIGYYHFTNQRRLSHSLSRAVEAHTRMGGGGRVGSHYFVGQKAFHRMELNSRGRNVDDEKLKHLAGLTGVVGLDLSDNPITDEGLHYVAEVPHLQWLQLSGTQITNEGLKHLNGLRHLRVLDLTRTQITQEAAQHLAEIPMLDAVYANGTNLRTVPGVAVDVYSEPDTWIDGRTVWPFPLPQD